MSSDRLHAPASTTPASLAGFVWGIADQLRGVYKPNQYGMVVLPLTILRRMEQVMAPHRQTMRELASTAPAPILATLIQDRTGLLFHNTSPWDLRGILEDPDAAAQNLRAYVTGFSANVADLFQHFEFEKTVDKLEDHGRLILVLQQFAAMDLSPEVLSNAGMGTMFEDLIRRFAAASNETAGEHFTPRDAVALIVDLLLAERTEELEGRHAIRHVYDPTAGTGGMLSILEDRLTARFPNARTELYGQELNDQSYAICKSDLIGRGKNAENIARGDTLKDDHHAGHRFDYVLSNPPYGGDWKASQKAVLEEIARGGAANRFPGGAPAISDGQMLFLQLVASKLRLPSQGGGRAGIVLNGSPLFTGGAGSGPSEIRRWLLESDLVDAIVALPTDMFMNTGIATYVWVLDNNKAAHRRGRVQLIDARTFFTKLRRNVGSKNKEVSDADRERILRIYRAFEDQAEEDAAFSKVLTPDAFGYREITVERPLQLRFEVDEATQAAALATKAVAKLDDDARTGPEAALASLRGRVWDHQSTFQLDLKKAMKEHGVTAGAPLVKALVGAIGVHDPEAVVVKDAKGNPLPDPALRDTELVPFGRDVQEYFEAEVAPHVPGAWIDESKTKIGYEIPFTRLFYVYEPPRPLEEIDAELKQLTAEIMELLQEVDGR